MNYSRELEALEIYTENPEEEMWRFLSRLTYPPHLSRLFNDKGLTLSENESNEIATYISQANDYFAASRNSSMQISPVLIYYGTVNLFSALRSLTRTSTVSIENHGMGLGDSSGVTQLTALEIIIRHNQSSGLINFAELFQDTNAFGDINHWPLGIILSYIPELQDDYTISEIIESSPPLLIPVSRDTEDVNKYYISSKASERVSDINLVESIAGYKSAFLPPNRVHDGRHVLRPKFDSDDITIESLSGRFYLRRYFERAGKKGYLSSEVAYLMALYALSVVSRYRPSIWNPFVTRDESGERWLIERFLFTARRVVPNLVINKIENRQIVFTNSRSSK